MPTQYLLNNLLDTVIEGDDLAHDVSSDDVDPELSVVELMEMVA